MSIHARASSIEANPAWGPICLAETLHTNTLSRGFRSPVVEKSTRQGYIQHPSWYLHDSCSFNSARYSFRISGMSGLVIVVSVNNHVLVVQRFFAFLVAGIPRFPCLKGTNALSGVSLIELPQLRRVGPFGSAPDMTLPNTIPIADVYRTAGLIPSGRWRQSGY